MKLDIDGEEFVLIMHALNGAPLQQNPGMQLLTLQFLLPTAEVARLQEAISKAKKNPIPQMVIDTIGKGPPS